MVNRSCKIWNHYINQWKTFKNKELIYSMLKLSKFGWMNVNLLVMEGWIKANKSAKSSWSYGRYFFWKQIVYSKKCNKPFHVHATRVLFRGCSCASSSSSAKQGVLTHLTGAHLRNPGMWLHLIWKRNAFIWLNGFTVWGDRQEFGFKK